MFKSVMFVVMLCLSLVVVSNSFAKQPFPKDRECIVLARVASICYIRGWAGKPTSYVDELTNGLKEQFKSNDTFDLTDTSNRVEEVCGTYFNVGRSDDAKGVDYRHAKLNQAYLHDSIPGQCMKALSE